MKGLRPWECLPFVVAGGKPGEVDFWRAVATGDLAADQAQGEAFADLALDYIRANDFPPLLGWIIAAMVRKGAAGVLETGFAHRLAMLAIGGGQ